MSDFPKVFHSPRWVTVFLILVTCGALAVASFEFLQHGLTLTVGGLTGFIILGAVGFLDFLFTRVELHEDRIVIVTNFRKRILQREEVNSVTWAAGSGVTIMLAGGQSLQLPDVGNSQSRANSIRAWLKWKPKC